MDTVVVVMNQYGPWSAFTIGELFLSLQLWDWIVDASFRKRQAQLIAQMSRAYREMGARELEKRPLPQTKKQNLTLGVLAIAGGLAWLALR